MHSIIADLHDLLKKNENIHENKIDNFWQQIIQSVPAELKPVADKAEFALKEDTTYNGDPFVTRYLVEVLTSSSELREFFKQNGPFIIYLKD